jgi:hypothetical protein
LTKEQRFKLWMRVVDGAISTLRVAVPWSAAVAIVAYASSAIRAFAGHRSGAFFGLELITSIHIDQWVAYIVAIMGGAYGFRQRNLRQKAIERLTQRPKELELLMDAHRSSSELTPQGTTRREDR